MTDTNFLKERIEQSGYKLKFIAGRLGIAHQGFLNKLDNKTEFKASEIQKLCRLLDIDINQKEKNFFANSVEYDSTR